MTQLKARPPSKRIMALDDPREARRIIRRGDYDGHTAGIAPEFVQGNLCILPSEMATEFAAFCQRNPKPCPLIGMGAPGDPSLPDLGDIDIRTDVPRYRVFKDGKLIDEPADVRKYWSDDLVTFVIGCSFSFEKAILDEGIRLQHVSATRRCRCIAPASIACRPAASAARWWCRCAPSCRPTRSAPCRSPRAFLPCMGRRCISACPRRSASPTSRGPIGAIRRDPRRRAAGILGLRGDAAGSRRGGAAIDLHHAQAGLDADHRQAQHVAGGALGRVLQLPRVCSLALDAHQGPRAPGA